MESVERFEVRPAGAPGWDQIGEYSWCMFVSEIFANVFSTKVALGQFHQQNAHVVWMFQHCAGGLYLDEQVIGRTRRYHKLIDE